MNKGILMLVMLGLVLAMPMIAAQEDDHDHENAERFHPPLLATIFSTLHLKTANIPAICAVFLFPQFF